MFLLFTKKVVENEIIEEGIKFYVTQTREGTAVYTRLHAVPAQKTAEVGSTVVWVRHMSRIKRTKLLRTNKRISHKLTLKYKQKLIQLIKTSPTFKDEQEFTAYWTDLFNTFQ